MTRKERFMPNGVPTHVRIYDNGGETADRYTVVYSGRYKGRPAGRTEYVGMSGAPFWPQGVCMHGDVQGDIDRPRYSHLGRKIRFEDLPEDCQKVVKNDYAEIWRL